MKEEQKILNFGHGTLGHCPCCNIVYNKLSKNDIAFHTRLHKKRRLPRCGEVSKGFYERGLAYYYGRTHVEGYCLLKRDGMGFMVRELWYETQEAREKLIRSVKMRRAGVKF